MGTVLFFDDWPLCYMCNVQRIMGRPKWVPEATLEDEFTEGTWNFPFVWYDKPTNMWKAIYGAALPMGKKPSGKLSRSQALMLAESKDGFSWKKPDVSTITTHVERHVCPNQVFGVMGLIDGAPVFLDEHDPDPNKRLKYLFNMSGKQGLAASPDGIRWKIMEDIEIGDYELDSPITCFYNHYRRTYCISRRLHCGDRRIAFIETPDWREFCKPEVIIHPDTEDPPLVQFYGMPVYRYEDLYIGLLWRMHCDPMDEVQAKGGGPIDCSLVYSLDGWHFNRATHKGFIDRNERGEHGGGCIYVGTMTIDDTPQIRFYSGGSKAEHFQNQEINDAALMLHILRLDGFFRLESYSNKGRIMTRTVVFTGEELKLNVRAPYGQVRVQISHPTGEPVNSFTFDDCISFTGDELFWQPRWKSGKTVDVFGKDIRDRENRYHIEVELTNAELYAIRGNFQMRYGSGLEGASLTYTTL